MVGLSLVKDKEVLQILYFRYSKFLQRSRESHHQHVVPTWVMHGSLFAPERSSQWRGRETEPITLDNGWPDGASQSGNFARTLGNPLPSVTSVMGSLMTTVCLHEKDDNF